MSLLSRTGETFGTFRGVDGLRQEVRLAARSLWRQKGFSIAAVATLGVGLGAATAIFSVVSALVLRPLPFEEPDELVQLYGRSALVPEGDAVSSLQSVRDQTASFEAIVGYEVSAGYVRAGEGAQRVLTVRAERDFFRMLGIPPLLGRTFDASDPAPVTVIGEAFWRQRFGGDPTVIGRVLTLDGETFTVIGVMPESFQFPYRAASLLGGVASEARTDVWLPLELRPQGRVGNVTGRLRDGVSVAELAAELEVVSARLAAQSPDAFAGRSVYAVSLADAVVPPLIRRPLFVLLGAVGIVLALACGNLTNLTLVRSTLRGRETAVRRALGAHRADLARQFLAESLLVSLVGALLGLGVAWWGTRRLVAFAGSQLPRAHELAPDWRVFLFLFSVCALAGAVMALTPIALSANRDIRDGLRHGEAGNTMAPGPSRLRDGLIVAEIALSFFLAVGAALLIREMGRLQDTDPGIVADNVITMHIGGRGVAAPDGAEFYEIAERVSGIPGVRAAGLTQLLPLQNWGWTSNSTDFTATGLPPSTAGEFPIELRYVTPGYFDALGITVRGRTFTVDDDDDGLPVVVINEELARRAFGDRDPIGIDTNRGMIVGVIGDIRQVHLDRPAEPELYFPISQNWSQVSELGMSLVASFTGSEAPVAAIRSAILEVDPNFAVFDVKTMDRVIDESLTSFSMYLTLMTGFALLALLLAATGTYGVIAHVAASRGREFAIRVSLGADRLRVHRLVLGRGLTLAAVGLLLGGWAVAAAVPLLRGLPITVTPPDLATAAPAAVVILLVALVACFIPSRRAARADPMTILRRE